jgi:hypothetical protein
MNRAKSITDIGSIYLEMQKRNAAQLNESVINESKKVKAKFPKDTFKKSEESVKEPSTFKKGGPKNVKGLNKPKKNKKFSQKSKKVVKEDINNFMSIFDKLYEDVMKNDELDINTGIGMGPEGSAGDEDFDMESDDSDMGGDDQVTLTMDKSVARELLDLLQAAVGDDTESESDSDLDALGVDTDDMDSESEDEDEEHEDEDEYGMNETIDIEKFPDSAGHKLTKHGTVGNIKASSGKADSKITDECGTETGKHPMDHKSELSNPSKNKVGTLKTGKSLFDQ